MCFSLVPDILGTIMQGLDLSFLPVRGAADQSRERSGHKNIPSNMLPGSCLLGGAALAVSASRRVDARVTVRA